MDVSLTLTKQTAYAGENLEAVCIIKTKTAPRVAVEWIKQIWDPASPEPKRKQIAINVYVNDDFKAGDRYKATASNNKEKTVLTFRLSITDLKNSDSGQIGCGVQGHGIEILKNFTVFAPITELVMESQDSPDAAIERYVNGSNEVFDEGEKIKFYCKATGGYPAAKMLITSGGKSITNQFKRIETLREDEGLFDVTLMAEEFVVDYSLYKKRLACAASIAGADNYAEKNIGIMVNLTGFKPKFLCKESIMVEMNKVNFNISCIVRSLPPIETASIGWQSIGNRNHTMPMGTKDGHYITDPLPASDMAMVSCMNLTDPRLSLNDSEPEHPAEAPAQGSPNSPDTTCVWPVEIQQGDSDEEMVMVLRIDRIFVQHFRKYYFTASNEKGEVTHTVELIQVKTGSSHSEATSHMIASLATIFLAAMATYFL